MNTSEKQSKFQRRLKWDEEDQEKVLEERKV